VRAAELTAWTKQNGGAAFAHPTAQDGENDLPSAGNAKGWN
jgi:hypothetical protein